jgi:hypothetical protein
MADAKQVRGCLQVSAEEPRRDRRSQRAYAPAIKQTDEWAHQVGARRQAR